MKPILFVFVLALTSVARADEPPPPEDALGADEEKAAAVEGGDSQASAVDLVKCAGEDCPETVVDRIFYVYGTLCSGMNWRFLNAVAKAESGLDPKNHTGKYVGLFQLDKDGCTENLTPFNKVLDCADLEDPEANTAAAANRFNRYFTGHANLGTKSNFPSILDTCPDNSAKENIALAYIGHNNGPAVLKHVLGKKACQDKDIRTAITSFYEVHPLSRDDGKYMNTSGKLVDCAKETQEKWGLVGTKSLRCVNAKWGIAKYEYGVKKVADVGSVDKLYVAAKEKTTVCPAVSGKRFLTAEESAKARDKAEEGAYDVQWADVMSKVRAAVGGFPQSDPGTPPASTPAQDPPPSRH